MHSLPRVICSSNLSALHRIESLWRKHMIYQNVKKLWYSKFWKLSTFSWWLLAVFITKIRILLLVVYRGLDGNRVSVLHVIYSPFLCVVETSFMQRTESLAIRFMRGDSLTAEHLNSSYKVLFSVKTRSSPIYFLALLWFLNFQTAWPP